MEVVAKKSASVLLYKTLGSLPYQEIKFEARHRIGDVWYMEDDKLPINALYNFKLDGEVKLPLKTQKIEGARLYGQGDTTRLARKVRIKPFGSQYKKNKIEDLSIYLTHIRGFTGSSSCDINEKKTFLGMSKNASYIKELGMNCVELMPVYDFEETIKGSKRLNYWGFTRGNYYAPKPSYAYSENEIEEFKELVNTFHSLGIDVILQFYFTRDLSRNEIEKILRHWIYYYGVDGFNLVNHELDVSELATSPYFANTRIFTSNYNSDRDNVFLCDDSFMYNLRKFVRGDDDSANNILPYLIRPSKRVNFASYHNGYTLADTFSYEKKHNEENGEFNRDGNDYNCSQNFGVEGKTEDVGINEKRVRAVKNALLLTFLARGIPRLYMGDEVMRTQLGNNNAYSLDGELSYLNYRPSEIQKSVLDFIKEIIKVKKEILKKNEYTSKIINESSLPRYSVHQEDAWQQVILPQNKHFGIYYEGKKPFFVGINMSFETQKVGLAEEIGKDFSYLIGSGDDQNIKIDGRYLTLDPFSVVIYSVRKRS